MARRELGFNFSPACFVGDIVVVSRGVRPEGGSGGLHFGQHVGERDDGAFLDEALGDGGTHAARGARDDGDLAGQTARAAGIGIAHVRPRIYGTFLNWTED